MPTQKDSKIEIIDKNQEQKKINYEEHQKREYKKIPNHDTEQQKTRDLEQSRARIDRLEAKLKKKKQLQKQQEAKTKQQEAKTKQQEAKTKQQEAKTKQQEAKTKQQEAKTKQALELLRRSQSQREKEKKQIEREKQQRENKIMALLKNVSSKTLQIMQEQIQKGQSILIKFVRNAIGIFLPKQLQLQWEQLINQNYKKYQASGWKWFVRIVIGAIIGILIGQLIWMKCTGLQTFVTGFFQNSTWLPFIQKNVAAIWRIAGGVLGAAWNSFMSLIRNL